MRVFVARHAGCSHAPALRVLEVGSRNVNGGVRDLYAPRQVSAYVGVDHTPGPGVDRVMDARELRRNFAAGAFDVVISTEMLEHAEEWRMPLWNMLEVLRYGGQLLLTTRSPDFPRHDFPGDHWRFTLRDLGAALRGFNVHVLESDPEAPGVFFCGTKRDNTMYDQLRNVRPQAAPSA